MKYLTKLMWYVIFKIISKNQDLKHVFVFCYDQTRKKYFTVIFFNTESSPEGPTPVLTQFVIIEVLNVYAYAVKSRALTLSFDFYI